MADRDFEYLDNIIGYCDKVNIILNEFGSNYDEFSGTLYFKANNVNLINSKFDNNIAT